MAASFIASMSAARMRLALRLLGLAILVAASARGAVPVQGSQLLAACALLALYGALDQVMALAPMRSGEVS